MPPYTGETNYGDEIVPCIDRDFQEKVLDRMEHHKIEAIKAFRAYVPGMGLKIAKDTVDLMLDGMKWRQQSADMLTLNEIKAIARAVTAMTEAAQTAYNNGKYNLADAIRDNRDDMQDLLAAKVEKLA